MLYRIKHFFYLGTSVSVICQNENGPCPLLALANCLLLLRKIVLPIDSDTISSQYLLNMLADHLLGTYSLHSDANIRIQQHDQLQTVIQQLPKLLRGCQCIFFTL
jgi:hypothetical protein